MLGLLVVLFVLLVDLVTCISTPPKMLHVTAKSSRYVGTWSRILFLFFQACGVKHKDLEH